MLFLLSDIHGNLEALEAVLDRVEEDAIVCLGDVVGYGPDSVECVRRSEDWKHVVSGQMDLAMLNQEPGRWNPTLEEHIALMRNRFVQASDSQALFKILNSYRSEFTSDGIRFFHGAPRNIRDWIFPEDVYCPAKLDEIVDSPGHALIGGGSHLPGLFRRQADGWEFICPENGEPYELPVDGRTIVTVGSVGQPRDGDPRAAYATTDGSTIVFHRVEYDIELTRNKINDDPGLPDMFGERLLFGR